MISRTTKQFWNLYQALPPELRERADKAYELWHSNPHSSGLQFKRVDQEEPIYSVRISLACRALGVLRGDTITWFWIGRHAGYERMLR